MCRCLQIAEPVISEPKKEEEKKEEAKKEEVPIKARGLIADDSDDDEVIYYIVHTYQWLLLV